MSQLPASAARDGTAPRGVPGAGGEDTEGTEGVGEVTVQFVAQGLPAAIVDTDARSLHRPPRTTRLAHGPHLLSLEHLRPRRPWTMVTAARGCSQPGKPPADEPFALAGTSSPRDLGPSAGCAHPGTRRTWWSRTSWPRQCWRRPLLAEVRPLVADAGARVTPRGSDGHLPGRVVPRLAPWSPAWARGPPPGRVVPGHILGRCLLMVLWLPVAAPVSVCPVPSCPGPSAYPCHSGSRPSVADTDRCLCPAAFAREGLCPPTMGQGPPLPVTPFPLSPQ